MLRRAFYWVRVLSLTALFAGACILYLWSKRDDPRFYRFLQTPTGRVLARTFRWRALPMDGVVREKTRAQMTPDELGVMRKLEEELTWNVPPDQVELTSGQVLTGMIMEEEPDHIVFRQAYGDSAEIAMTIERAKIKKISPYTVRLPPVTYRDICYKMELPDLHFFKAQPYSFLTDESYFSVMHAVNELQVLHRQFSELFGPLIDQARGHNDIQVLFFGNEDKYRAYQRQVADDLEYAVGFYSPVIDRLVVFNQVRGLDVVAIQKSVSNREAGFRAAAQSEDEEKQITEWRKDQDLRIAGFAAAQTRATIRHEGAHQLFYTYGVHSKYRAENDWLIEGLACFCETDKPGDLDAGRVRAVQIALQNGRIIPLAQLVDTRGGFGEFGGQDRIGLAYSESWSLVLFLMQREYRARFFDYMMYVRRPENLESIRKTPRLDLLAKFENATAAEFDRRWKEFVEKL